MNSVASILSYREFHPVLQVRRPKRPSAQDSLDVAFLGTSLDQLSSSLMGLNQISQMGNVSIARASTHRHGLDSIRDSNPLTHFLRDPWHSLR